MKPPEVGKPLPAAELEKDAAEAGVEGDQATAKDVDPHLPASESAGDESSRRHARRVEQDLINLPPG